MKETLSKKHSDALKHYTSEGITDNVIYKEGIKNLHTAAVARAAGTAAAAKTAWAEAVVKAAWTAAVAKAAWMW